VGVAAVGVTAWVGLRADAVPTRAEGTPAPVASAAVASACPSGMVLVAGMACPEVEHTCLRWLDPPGSKYARFRCAEYARPARCRGARRAEAFCIDVYERRAEDGLPANGLSWNAARRLCEASGARLCTDREWTFACEGEEMRPYAYGWARDATVCNVEIGEGLGRVGKLVDHRARAEDFPRCLSPFGVHGMAGNVDEWSTHEGLPPGKREVMKGSWWIPGRHTCRGGQFGHGASYGGTESGARCCHDVSTSR